MSRYKVIKKDITDSDSYILYVLENDYVIRKITESNNTIVNLFFKSTIAAEAIATAWSNRANKTYTNDLRVDLFDDFVFSDFYLSKYRKQKLNGVSDTHLLDYVGNYHGTQYEKYAYDSDGTAKIESVHITDQTVINSDGTAALVIASGEIQIGSGWVANIELSDGTLYRCEEQSGLTAFDASGNGNDGSLTGGLSHLSVRSKGVVNYTNEYGYTYNSGVIVPRVVNSDLDAQGNPCEFKGPVCSDMKLINSACVELSDTGEYGELNIPISETINLISFSFEAGSNPTKTTLFALSDSFDNHIILNAGKISCKFTNNNYKNTTTIVEGGIYDVVVDYVNETITINGDSTLVSTTETTNANTQANIWIGAKYNNSSVLQEFHGKIWNVVIEVDADDTYYFPIAESGGLLSYASNDKSNNHIQHLNKLVLRKTLFITWNGSFEWSSQSEYHYNINNGFNGGALFNGSTSYIGYSLIECNEVDIIAIIDFNCFDLTSETEITDTISISSTYIKHTESGETIPFAFSENTNYSLKIKYEKIGFLVVRFLYFWINDVYVGSFSYNASTDPDSINYDYIMTSRLGDGYNGIMSRFYHLENNIVFANQDLTTENTSTFDYTDIAFVRLPYSDANGKKTHPKCNGHNNAETQLQMEVFREKLGDSGFHYDQTDLSSEVIGFDDIVDTDNEVFVKELNLLKVDIETFLPGNYLFKFKRK